ncbi:MAG: V-type ATP synthase subunit E family protein [Promethearchaeia archaeon]
MGLYLIENAKEKVKEINQTTLFQKAEIKKNYLKRIEENSLRIKNYFLETYNQFLNKSLSEMLSKAKDEVLLLKNHLLEELKNEIEQNIKSKISEKYPSYIKFFIDSVKNVIHIIDKRPTVFITLNSEDFTYFKTNFNKIQDLFKNKVEIIKSDYEFIGGFKVILSNKNIIYDYTIDNFLMKNSTIIEKEFSIVFSESEIKNLQSSYEIFIQNKKLATKGYIKDYD